MMSTATATFAAGCFWGVEAAFRQIPGVLEVTSGYTGGGVANPSYQDVCTGRTGHAEAVQVAYDPAQVSYERLLDAFWQIHDPTTPDRQGPDVGTQYRSAIFTHGAEQQRLAEESRAKEQANQRKPIVTEIVAATEFYPAEEYHQRYFEKNGGAACHIAF
jgi:peptide-methionine (S)-S-oxide reductase